MLNDFIRQNRSEIIARTRARHAQRMSPRVTVEALQNGVPMFLDELVAMLEGTPRAPSAAKTAEAHGRDLLRLGFRVAQVVEEYGDICQALTELAVERDVPITTEEFRALNETLDEATAQAVGAYDERRAESAAAGQAEKLGSFAHELRNLLGNATLANALVRRGDVGVGGKTAGVLSRSLEAMRDLVDRALVDVRLDSGVHRREAVDIAMLIEDAEIVAAIVARERGIAFSVLSAPPGVAVEGDRQILAGALTNLLQNALKFTPVGGHVSLLAKATDAGVQIDVVDQCGGMPADVVGKAFQPFAQHDANRSGLGLGLSIARRGVEANGGELRVENLPGYGCIFSIVLPRHQPE